MTVTNEQKAYDNVGASKPAIQHHYDAGNAFYERFLGSTMAYSAGIWQEPALRDTLDNAQNRKLDWHIDWAQADIARRVLDVGCGWGSLIRRLSERNPETEIVGLTMSDAQAGYLRSRVADRCEINVTPWQNYQANRPFDSIISVEAIEHFASVDLDQAQKVRAYRDFFEFCAGNLKPGGRLTLQTSTWNNVDPGQEREFSFIHRFFPESTAPRFPDLVAAADGLFHVIRVEAAPRDFVYTLREWVKRLRRDEASLTREFGAEQVQTYIKSFFLLIPAFVNGTASLYRIALERSQPQLVSTMSSAARYI